MRPLHRALQLFAHLAADRRCSQCLPRATADPTFTRPKSLLGCMATNLCKSMLNVQNLKPKSTGFTIFLHRLKLKVSARYPKIYPHSPPSKSCIKMKIGRICANSWVFCFTFSITFEARRAPRRRPANGLCEPRDTGLPVDSRKD